MNKFLKQLLLIGPITAVVVTGSSTAQENIPKFLLIKLTRDQAGAMCSSDVFTQCMGFDSKMCLDVSEKAIETCLGPLPDEIKPETLENATLEACPQKIYAEAGFSEEKAKMCFDKAMEASSG